MRRNPTTPADSPNLPSGYAAKQVLLGDAAKQIFLSGYAAQQILLGDAMKPLTRPTPYNYT